MIAFVMLTGCSSSSGGDGGGGGSSGFHAVDLPNEQTPNDVRAVYCTAPDKCIIATRSNVGDPGAVFAVSDTAVGAKLLDGVYMGPVSAVSSVLGDLDFIGFEPTRNGVVAHITASSVYAVASGDVTAKASWSFVNMGRESGDPLPLNAMAALQQGSDGQWLFINKQGAVYGASHPPSATTAWTIIWQPDATPSVPADFEDQLAADPTLCDADVTAGGLPEPSSMAYIAQDLSVMVTPAGGLNQSGSARPGVCISVDRGAHFYNVAFTGVPEDVSSPGPVGVTCADKDTCWAYNGLTFQAGTAYIYYTTNASAGKTSTWTRAMLPTKVTTGSDTTLSGIFFAPDKMHGWTVGNLDHHALVLRTTDGGRTWQDVSDSVQGVKDNDLYNGFALDNDHVWLAGRFGTLMATRTAQQ
jgi:photosynthesis system II assembly factor YCF48-like protein